MQGVNAMVFQKEFQTYDIPEKNHATCSVYNTKPDGSYPMHCHSFYEISYVIKGERYEIFNGKQYHLTENTLLFIPPLAFHSNYNVQATDVAVIQFSPSFLRGNCSEMGDNLILNRPADSKPVFMPEINSDTYNALYRIIEISADGVLLPNYAPATILSDQFRKNGLILEMLSAMLHEKYIEPMAGNGVSTKSVYLDRIIEHILKNPAEKTDMQTAAKMANMSYYSFSRVFKDAVGMNYSDYCNLLRVRLAEEKLISTDLPISDIAAAIGIDTQSYFSRLFKNVNGVSPIEFRNKNRAK